MKPISWYKSLSLPKHRRQHGYFLIEGARAVDQLLTYHSDRVSELLCVDGYLSAGTAPSTKNIPIRIISESNMKAICASKTPQGVAALVRIPNYVYTSNIPKPPGNRILLLEHVQDPGNAGTLIRTAAAFGFDGVIMSDKCADPFSPKAVQASAGSLLSVWIRKTEDYMRMVADIKNICGHKLIGADLGGADIRGWAGGMGGGTGGRDGGADKRGDGAGQHILALGNEGAGLTGELLRQCDLRTRIPVDPSGAESLNVAVSGGILMYMLSLKR